MYKEKIREKIKSLQKDLNSGPVGNFGGVTVAFVDEVKFTPNELINIKGATSEEKYRMTGAQNANTSRKYC